MTKMKAFLLGFLLPAIALAGSSTDRLVSVPFNNSQFGLRNFVTNPDAEKNVSTGVTTSGATVSRNTSTPIEGKADFSVSLGNNATDTVTWAMGTLDNKLKNNNCELRASYTASSIGSNVVLQVLQGSSVVAQSPALATASNPTVISVNAPCGDLSSATTAVLRNSTGNSGTGSVKIDSLYYGLATNLSQVSQAQWYGAVSTTNASNCSWNYTGANGTWTDLPADTDCNAATPSGFASAPSSKIPAITFQSLPPGRYKFELTGGILSASSSSGLCTYRFSDGTNGFGSGAIFRDSTGGQGANIIGTVEYTTAQSNITIRVQNNSSNGAVRCDLSLQSGYELSPMQINVYRFPTSSEIAVRPDTTPASWSGYQNGISGGCSTTSASYADPSACTSITLNQTSNINMGTVTTTGSSLPGIDFTPPRVGRYLIEANISMSIPASQNATARLVDSSGTLIDPGRRGSSGNNNSMVFPLHLMGIYNVTSLGSKTIKVQMATTGGTASITQLDISTGASVGWNIIELDAAMPAPLLVGSVTSNSSGITRVTSGSAVGSTYGTNCTSSPCVVMNGLSDGVTVTWSYTGGYTINFPSGMFSAAPSCTTSATVSGVGRGVCGPAGTTTSTTWSLDCVNMSNTASNVFFNFQCAGPR